ncbi:MAG: hypothetical protein AABX73_04640 [Nanoarchaeota archaeon]
MRQQAILEGYRTIADMYEEKETEREIKKDKINDYTDSELDRLREIISQMK